MRTHLNRRSFFARVVGASIISGGALSTIVGKTYAQSRTRSCLTDADRTDRPDYGTRTGLTDTDSSDQAGRGTLTHRTDSDTTDIANRGRSWRCAARGTGVTDNDSGANADRAGYGRGGSHGGVSDHDSGPNADRAGYGRGASSGRSPTDSDPYDPPSPAHGRTGVTDNDATDGSGHGRGSSRPPPAPPPPQPTRERVDDQPSAGPTMASPPPPPPSSPSGQTTTSQGGEADNCPSVLPQFPWPPPTPTEPPLKLPHRQIAASLGSNKSLRSLGRHIVRALNQAGYADHTFYRARHGFAVVSRLERIEADGRSSPSGFRYTPPGQEEFSLSRYLSGLFVAPIGRYRQIVFIVTDLPVVAVGGVLTQQRAGTLLHGGGGDLDACFESVAFGENYDVTALIYEFQKTGESSQMRQLDSSSLTAIDHLRAAGLYPAIVR